MRRELEEDFWSNLKVTSQTSYQCLSLVLHILTYLNLMVKSQVYIHVMTKITVFIVHLVLNICFPGWVLVNGSSNKVLTMFIQLIPDKK